MDRDADGHLEFDCIETAFLKNYTQQQKSFFFQVHEEFKKLT